MQAFNETNVNLVISDRPFKQVIICVVLKNNRLAFAPRCHNKQALLKRYPWAKATSGFVTSSDAVACLSLEMRDVAAQVNLWPL